ncbi:MAG TPA: transposase [Methanomicrobia archaeon]|nr:transposase [Methanomicrobia archaeon]HEX59172.1 transposase [Methanomicrobia archaeon]
MIVHKCRLYPTAEQEEKLLFVLEQCRWLYNRLLEEVNKAMEEGRKINQRDTQALIVLLKEERPELKEVNSKVLQMVNHRLWSNMRALHELKKRGKKVGKLRYKKYGKYKSFVLNQSGFRIIKTGKRLDRLYISKVEEVPIRIHRPIEGKIKQVIVKRYSSGEWYAFICVEEACERKQEREKRNEVRAVGIDLGVRNFLTDSDGREVENPRFYERELERLRVEHRKLSRKKKGSKNWEKQLRRLCKVYERIERKRNDFLHKLSRFYVDNYDLIVVEDLEIENMKRNHNLSSEISDASWGKFLCYLSYKAERAGKTVVKVPPRGTSRGLSMDDPLRDYISARRILKKGLEKLGLGRPSEPAERRPLLRITAFAVITGQVASVKQEPPLTAGCPSVRRGGHKV